MFNLKYQYYIRALIAIALAYLRAIAFRVLGKQHLAPPRPGDKFVNTEWLRFVLESNGYTRFSIKAVHIGDMDNNRGLAGQINKIRLEYDPSKTVGEAPPSRFVLKTSQAGFFGKAATIFHAHAREAGFYSEPRFRNFASNIPRVFYAYGSNLMGELVMLQEDVSVLNAVPTNFIFGNQIWGCPAVEPPRDVVSTLETIFVTAAKQHAQFWNERSLLQLSWLKGAAWYHNQGQKEWEHAFARGKAHWESAKRKAAASKDGSLRFSEKLISIIDQSYANSSWSKLQAHLKNAPFTLCHGDFHASNMFMVREDVDGKQVDRPIWFDWSEVGPGEGTTDLAQMIISDIKPAISNTHAKPLVRAYWQALIDNGVSAQQYPWDACWNAFARGGAERWIYLFSVLADFPLPPNAIQYFHDQLFTFIANHCPTQPHFELKTLVFML